MSGLTLEKLIEGRSSLSLVYYKSITNYALALTQLYVQGTIRSARGLSTSPSGEVLSIRHWPFVQAKAPH